MDPVQIGIYLLPLLLGILAYLRNSLDLTGSIVGIILAYLFVYLGIPWFSLMFWFFLLGTIATRIGYEKKKALGEHQKTRGALNVLGNSLVGMAFALISNPYGAASAFSAAAADTASSEIGLLSKEKPVSILTRKEVPPGYNGGVTLVGCMAMVVMSVIFSLVPLYFWGWKAFWISSLGGIAGSLIDSVLGDAFESKGKWGNHTTNFLATLGAGLVGWALAML